MTPIRLGLTNAYFLLRLYRGAQLALLFLLCLFLLPNAASAAVCQWTGKNMNSDLWSDGNNWDPPVAPQTGDTVIFGSGVPTGSTYDLPAGTKLEEIMFGDS